MTIQFDVKSTNLAASGSVFGGPSRIKGILISYASGGTLSLQDGGSSGATVFTFTAPAAAGSVYVTVPGDGIKCNTNIYAAISSTNVTVFYG